VLKRVAGAAVELFAAELSDEAGVWRVDGGRARLSGFSPTAVFGAGDVLPSTAAPPARASSTIKAAAAESMRWERIIPLAV
jgi:hypothetical protein